MSKFTTTNAPKIDTNLKPFSSTNQNVQGNSSGNGHNGSNVQQNNSGTQGAK